MGSLDYRHLNNSKERLLPLSSFRGGEDAGSKFIFFNVIYKKFKNACKYLQDFVEEVWKMGCSDPRKVIFAMKMGLALAIVSLLIFWKGPYENVAQYSIWAILTVIVVFEFSIGATFIKGFNRGLGTLCAAILAICFSELSLLVGKWEEVVIVISIFLMGFCSSYLKLHPTMTPYEYGFRVFIMTYCILMVAGNRTREYKEAIITRLALIAAGAGVCFLVNIFIYPIWAGEALHGLVVKNFKDLATSLEGCVNGYLKCVEYERIPSKILTYQASDDPLYNSYRSVVESTSREDTLLGFAIWEPPHGRYRRLNYPWKSYITVSGALRHCAFTVMALHGCILSEIQASPETRQVFSTELRNVGAEGAKVLRELGSKLEKMEKLSPGDILKEVHEAADQLQEKIDRRSYLLVNSARWEIGRLNKELEEQEDKENKQLGFKSLSETLLDLRSDPVLTLPLSIDASKTMFTKQVSSPAQISLNVDSCLKEDECRTYESARALSLATFASLLIEFVARLQNIVDSFEELSEKADFKEPNISRIPTAKKRFGA
ncbi:hypothetical protein SLA2020_482730 [Shorea laevis]